MRRHKVRISATSAIIGLVVGGIAGIALAPGRQFRATMREEFALYRVSGGTIVQVGQKHNRLVGPGIRQLCMLLTGTSSAPYDTAAYICVGEDSTVTDTVMTGLQGDSLSWANVDSVTYGADNVAWWATYGSEAGNHSWREVGIFNDSAGTMLGRATVSWGAKTASDTWIVRYKITWE